MHDKISDILFATYLPKIIEIGRNFTKFWQNKCAVF